MSKRLEQNTNLVFKSPPIPLSVEEDFCSQPITDRRLDTNALPETAALPVAFDMVLDFVMPRD